MYDFIPQQLEIQFPVYPYFPDDVENYAPWVSEHGLNAPYGMCQCGRCDLPSPIAKLTHNKWGHLRNHPVRFVSGHQNRRPIEISFWEKVDTSGGPDDCWLWTGSKTIYGYGCIGRNRLAIVAHRISWEIHNGPIPEGMNVLHTCDALYPPGDITNRSCVNPAHLYLGTQADNVSDMMERGRKNSKGAPGASNSHAKITEEQVKEIRRRYAGGEKQTHLAREYGINQGSISAIILRATWKHVP